MVDKVDTKYVEAGRWKCSKAPIDNDVALQVANNTGAHHWIKLEQTRKLAEKEEFYCKWCYDVRRLSSRIERFKEKVSQAVN